MNRLLVHKAVFDVQQTFKNELSARLNLTQLLAPKFLKTKSGIQDDLAQTCESVKFHIPACGYEAEMVHSLAKWKRIMLAKYQIPCDYGIYVDMDAIRKDEKIDDIHSIYVDQLDWEINMGNHPRSEKFLVNVVRKIYEAMKATEIAVNKHNIVCLNLRQKLPHEIHFIHANQLYKMYPTLTAREREKRITQQFGAVFIIGIGHCLDSGEPHDLRAFDYDDWNLNGDIIVWDQVRKDAIELSSMGIRVNPEALIKQAEVSKQAPDTYYHQLIMNSLIPQSIGGGIGYSRLAMFLLERSHIGEVQTSEWPESIVKDCSEKNIYLL